MRSVIEAYIGIWSVLFLLLIATAFTSINMNVKNAVNMYDDLKEQVEASNGAFINSSDLYSYDSNSSGLATLDNNGYKYNYSIQRLRVTDENITDSDETYIYNNIYKITFNYTYVVPLFGRQEYPIVGFTN